ncbi:MAG: hypothetical protein KAJ23_07615 [Maribacter sp.]|nr:hypothetical protein [Maribacter sp.]
MKIKLVTLVLCSIFLGCSSNDPEPSIEEEVMSAPTLSTTAISQITPNTAMSGGDITDDGGSAITARGVCWNTNENPTINDSRTTDGSSSGSFTSTTTALEANQTYYIRAYATNSEGTSYGQQLSFTTLETPELAFEGDLLFLSQKEVDDFAGQGYTQVNGKVTIGSGTGEETDITNLDGLGEITSIASSLTIFHNDQLLEIDGLYKIETIGGDLAFQFNDAIDNIDGFSGLTTIGGSLFLWGNDLLSNINGLSNLIAVGDEVSLQRNNELISVDGLEGLTIINGDLSIDQNHKLLHLGGLTNIKAIGGD